MKRRKSRITAATTSIRCRGETYVLCVVDFCLMRWVRREKVREERDQAAEAWLLFLQLQTYLLQTMGC